MVKCSALLTLILGFVASPAGAFEIDLLQSGGTAVSGHGGPGDTLRLDVVVTLDAADSAESIFTTLQWDLEGGDVLDVVSSQIPSQLVNGTPLTPLGTTMRLGDPADSLRASGVSFDRRDPVYPFRSGPAGLFSIAGVTLGTGFPGPVSFTLGSVEFVMNSSDPTEVSFFFGPAYSSLVNDPDFNDITDQVSFGRFAVNAPEPSTGLLLGLGLSLASALRRRVA